MPVPPVGVWPHGAPSLKAGPAMSRCAHGVVAVNSRRNSPAVSIPPQRVPVAALRRVA